MTRIMDLVAGFDPCLMIVIDPETGLEITIHDAVMNALAKNKAEIRLTLIRNKAKPA